MDLSLYMDQDSLDAQVAAGIRRAGMDVLMSSDVGRERAPDSEQLAYAASLRRVIYTANRGDYARLHAEWMGEGRTHWGIIIRSRQQISVREQIRALVAIGRESKRDDWKNRIVYL